MGGASLALVGAAAVLLTDRVLDDGDTSSARAIVTEARDMLARELDEGDGLQEALDEVVPSGRAPDAPRTARVTGRVRGGPPKASGPPLPELADGACATVVDPGGAAWRACGASVASVTLVAAVPLTAHHQAVRTLAQRMLAVTLLSVVALWLLGKHALRRPLAELAALVGWTARVVETEQPAPPPPSSSREIADLAGAFEALVRRLIEVVSRERASSAHIAHELRTPLTVIAAGLDALQSPDAPSNEAVRKIRADVARFAEVIEAILVLSSSERGGGRADVVVNVADLARRLAPRGVSVLAPDEALVQADEPLVALALRNLIDNAERHGRGVRSIDVRREGDALSLEVVDAGPGLNETERGRMFERYWRAAADGEGRGLGLALVKAVAERHDGTARAEPGPSGTGLRVVMTIGRVIGWHEDERSAGR